MNRGLDKLKIADSFLKSIKTYEQNSQVQELVAERLLTLCKNYIPARLDKVLEVGCGTGLLTRKFIAEFSLNQLVLSDLSADLCRYSKNHISDSIKNIELLSGDIEEVELPSNCDLILSSSALQWLVDIDKFLEQCAKALKKNGQIAFSMFGIGTMQEIAALTGKGLNYYSEAQLVETVEKYFNVEYAEQSKNTLFFNSVKEIVKHIRSTGVAGVNQSPLTVAQYKKFEQEYEKTFKTEAGLPVSYNTLFMIAKKK